MTGRKMGVSLGSWSPVMTTACLFMTTA